MLRARGHWALLERSPGINGVSIKQFEFREKVRTFFSQRQSKLSVIMRLVSVHIKWVSVKRALTMHKQNKRTCWTWF